MDSRAIVAMLLVAVVMAAIGLYGTSRVLGAEASVEAIELWLVFLNGIVVIIATWMGGGRGD